MSWLYSQVLVEVFLGANSSDGEQSVQSNGNPTQQAYCAPDKMTDFSRLSRFGMTFKPLTESRGEELLTWYLEGFRVRTSPPQAREMDLTENAAPCGLKWRGWLAKYDHSTCSWKTAQCSLLEEESESLVTLPRWGMTVDGLLWEQPTLEPNTKETECGLWPTPTTPSGGGNCGGSGAYKNALKNGTYIPHSINPNLYEWLMGWPLGWTDLKPLEMDKSLSAPPPLSES
jgi:hypothetical protein